MFARAASVFVLALPLLATANVLPRNGSGGSECDTGSLQCCSSVQSSTSTSATAAASLLGLLGIVTGPITGLVGLTCNPILGILSSTSCNQQAACCTGNSFSGIIVVGCSPINVGA